MRRSSQERSSWRDATTSGESLGGAGGESESVETGESVKGAGAGGDDILGCGGKGPDPSALP